MAYTTPRTYVAGEVHTAAHHNTYERDNIAWLATDAPCVSAYKSTAFSHTTNLAHVAATFDQENFDNASVHSTSTNTSRLTIPSGAAGKWLVGGWGYWDNNTSGTRGVRVFQNGVFVHSTDIFAPASAALGGQEVTAFRNQSAADYLELHFYQSSGGTRSITNILGGTGGPEFWAFWVRN